MNKIFLIGNVVRDIDVQVSGAGVQYAKFTLAVQREHKKEGKPEADFFDCFVYDKTAVFAAKYFHKGSPVIVEGRMESSKTEKDGQKRTYWEVAVEKLRFAPRNNGTSESANVGNDEPTPVNVPAEDLPF